MIDLNHQTALFQIETQLQNQSKVKNQAIYWSHHQKQRILILINSKDMKESIKNTIDQHFRLKHFHLNKNHFSKNLSFRGREKLPKELMTK